MALLAVLGPLVGSEERTCRDEQESAATFPAEPGAKPTRAAQKMELCATL